METSVANWSPRLMSMTFATGPRPWVGYRFPLRVLECSLRQSPSPVSENLMPRRSCR